MPILWARLAYMCNVPTPMLDVANALNANDAHIPLMSQRKTPSSQSVLYGVAISNSDTIGLYLLSKSWRVNNQSNVAVVKCWIWVKKTETKVTYGNCDKRATIKCSYQRDIRVQAFLNVQPTEFGTTSAHPQHQASRQNYFGGCPAQSGRDQFAMAFARNARQHYVKTDQVGKINTASEKFLQTKCTSVSWWRPLVCELDVTLTPNQFNSSLLVVESVKKVANANILQSWVNT